MSVIKLKKGFGSDQVLCQECQKQGKKSKVRVAGANMTQLKVDTFYDEEGWLHKHDPNLMTIRYVCTNGHGWTEKQTSNCWCGFHGQGATVQNIVVIE
jgi:hypothetical protein